MMVFKCQVGLVLSVNWGAVYSKTYVSRVQWCIYVFISASSTYSCVFDDCGDINGEGVCDIPSVLELTENIQIPTRLHMSKDLG